MPKAAKSTSRASKSQAAAAPAQAPAPSQGKWSDDTVVDCIYRSIKGETVTEIHAATGVATSSIHRFLGNVKLDPRQTEEAHEKMLAKRQNLRALAQKRFDEEQGKSSRSSRSGTETKAAPKPKNPLPAAQRVATSGSTSRSSPYAKKTSDAPLPSKRSTRGRPFPRAEPTSLSTGSKKRSKASADSEEDRPVASGSGIGSRVKSTPKALSRSPSVASSPRLVPVVEIPVFKKRRHSLAKSTVAAPSPLRQASSPDRPVASTSRLAASRSPIASGSAISPRAKSSTPLPLPLPDGLVDTMPPVSPRKQNSPAPDLNEHAASGEDGDASLDNDTVSKEIIEEALTTDTAAEPVTDSAAVSSHAESVVTGDAEVDQVAEEAEVEQVEEGLEEEPSKNEPESAPVAEDEQGGPQEESPTEEDQIMSGGEREVDTAEASEAAQEKDVALGDLESDDAVEVDGAAQDQPEETIGSDKASTSVDPEASSDRLINGIGSDSNDTEDFEINIAAAMEAVVRELESSPVSEGQDHVEEKATEGVKELGVEPQIVLEHAELDVVIGEEEQAFPLVSARAADVNGAGAQEIAMEVVTEETGEMEPTNVDRVTEAAASPEETDSLVHPIAYPLTIGQEHVSAEASLPKPYSRFFGSIWPSLS